MQTYPRVFAHRGASGYCVENTIAAMRLAKSCGAKWVEFDVMLAKCGTPIVFHDEDLWRLTGIKANIRDCTYQELKQIVLANPFGTEKNHIPTLQEMLELLATLQLNANIEIKPLAGQAHVTVEKAWPIIRPFLSKINIIFSSFSYSALKQLRQIAPDVNIAFLMNHWRLHWRQLAKALNASAIHINARSITKRRVQAIKNQGLFVAAYTVNSIELAEELYAAGVDGIFSDYPEKMLNLVY